MSKDKDWPDSSEMPRATSIMIGVCEHCKGAHLVFVTEDKEPIAEGVIGPEEAIEFCNNVLRAVGSKAKVVMPH